MSIWKTKPLSVLLNEAIRESKKGLKNTVFRLSRGTGELAL
jgi:hypothetical protein